MIPQLYLVAKAENGPGKDATVVTNFIGLLGCARVLRMIFWFGTVVQHLMYAVYPDTWPMMVGATSYVRGLPGYVADDGRGNI